MREIKFRAWSKEKNIMHYDAEQAYNGHFQMNDIQCFGELISSPDYDLMQFTGLKDKNKRRIYEGDILRSSNNGAVNFAIGVVTYGKYIGHTGFYVDWKVGMHKDLLVKDLGFWVSRVEVVGNIFEMPELLEER